MDRQLSLTESVLRTKVLRRDPAKAAKAKPAPAKATA
jgi:ribosomal protein S6